MLKTTRQLILEVKSDTQFSMELGTLDRNIENLIVSRLDNAQDIITDEILKVDPVMLSTYVDITLDGSENYYLPDYTKYDYELIPLIEDVTNSTSPVKTIYTLWGDKLTYQNDYFIESYEHWSLRNNYLEVPFKTSSGTLRVWYIRRPTGFFYCTAASGSTTTAVLPTSMSAGELVLDDDYYIGMKVCTNSQVTKITDYVASTRTLTFDAQTTAIGSSTVVDLMSPFPERYQQLIVDVAVRRMRLGQNDNDTPIANYIQENISTMKHRLGTKTTQTPKMIRKTDFY